MEQTLFSAYDALVRTNELIADPAQRVALEKLDRLRRAVEQGYAKKSRRRVLWRRLTSPQPIKGLYIFGPVGRGKTIIMDLFYAHTHIPRKKRIHFHAFMQEIQRKMKESRERQATHPVQDIVNALAAEANLLCIDEFIVEHIGDAMILKSLFEKLFRRGVIVVATSNTPPQDLYKDGFQREQFLPFIQTLCQHVEIYELAGPLDYRAQRKGEGGKCHLFTPLDKAAQEGLVDVFKRQANNTPQPEIITIAARSYQVIGQAQDLVWFSFAELCEKARGAKDYLALSSVFSRWIISEVPQLEETQANDAKRFQILIDVLYEARVELWMSAATVPSLLYLPDKGKEAFKRTVSRVNKMLQADVHPAIHP